MTDPTRFRFSIDRGGTFTDIYAEVPGEPGYRVVKLLSEDPRRYADAPREGIRRILEDVTGRKMPPHGIDAGPIEWIRMGTTVATNALLERTGARCALAVTRGFGDILQIGNQDRPRIFDLKIQKPDLLYETVVEVDERVRLLRPDSIVAPRGPVKDGITGDRFEVLQAPDLKALEPRLQALLDRGIRSLAVVFLHAYAFPDHERQVGEMARKLGFDQISLSSRVMPSVKMVARGDTTLVDAYLNPPIRRYLNSFREGFSDPLAEDKLWFMQSDGALARADDFTGSRAVLSGPAGGVVGCAITAGGRRPQKPVIAFDMGGTSTDVSRFGGDYELVHETETAGVRIQAPQLHIKTVAAGGGSRLFFENGMLRVGPASAGAEPGPVCYRKNGYPAITDANLVLGRLVPEYFPRIFGPGENQPLDADASRAAMNELTRRINSWYRPLGRPAMTVEETALGFIRVANETMVRPIREISVQRGFDIQNHVLAAFGGAGPQHACGVARLLGIREIFIHRFSGILSAYGMGLADTAVELRKPAAAVLGSDVLPSLLAGLTELQKSAQAELAARGFSPASIESTVFLNLRYRGTDTARMIPRPADDDFAGALKTVHLREFGFVPEAREILVDDLRVRSRGKTPGLRPVEIPRAETPPAPVERRRVYYEGGFQDTAVFSLEHLRAGHEIRGPAIVVHDTSTLLIEPDCQARITDFGDVVLRVGRGDSQQPGQGMDPVQLAIFSHLFSSIAEQMGRMLQKTAVSVNIKERLDFSCALFGPRGDLVANAPHLPVHLGAMSEAVKAQIRLHGAALEHGDVLVSNHPAAGGSHLPDMTVITPVFHNGEIIFWTASRGHHADIGGISPGSMPANFPLSAGRGGLYGLLQTCAKRPLSGSRHHRPVAGPRKPAPAARPAPELRHPVFGGQYFRSQGPGGGQPKGHGTGPGDGGGLGPGSGAGLYGVCPGSGGSRGPVGPQGACGRQGDRKNRFRENGGLSG